MMTTGSVQFALPLEEDRPSKHIAARGCGPLASAKRSSRSKAKVPAAQLHRSSLRKPDDAGRSSALCRGSIGWTHCARKSKARKSAGLAETFREVNAKAEKLFKGRRFWGAARPLLEHAAAELGAGGPAAADTARIMAMHRAAGALQTRRHCRQIQRAPADGRPHDLARAH